MSILSLAFSAVLGSAWQLDAQQPVTAQVMSASPDWRLIDTVPSGAPAQNTQMWQVNPNGVADLPVSATQKDMVNEAFADDPDGSGTSNDVIYMSQELLAAMENPNFPAGYEAYVDPDYVKGKFSFGCSWDSETRNRTYPYSQNLLNQSLPFSGGIQGQLSLNLPVSGQVTLAATYKIRKCFGVPVGFKFVSATASGNASIAGNGDLQASASASATWDHEWKLAEPELGDVTFVIGWIPVRLVFTLPIYAGTTLNASISGNLTAHLGANANGTFSYTCTTDDCSGTSNFTDNFAFTGPTGAVQAKLDATAYARVMLRVGVYDESIAYVEGGLKAYAKAGIWGYLGNGCGDADGDGNNETVQALLADLSWGYQFAYGMGGWLLPDRLNYTGGSSYPLGWLDLLGTGGSTVLTPMISGSATATQGTAATYTVKMRPCYPYTDAVNFTMTPGTWTGATSVTPPAGSSALQTTFLAAGNQTITATAVSDATGRNFQSATSRTIAVAPTVPAPPSVPVAVPLSPTSVQFTWRDNSNNETQFLIERRPAGAGGFTQIGTVGANVTTYIDNTVVAATAYDYHVRASNSAGASGFSNVATVTTPLPAPAAPTGLVATLLSSTSVRLNWTDNSNNETQFGIERRLSPSGTFAQIATVGANVATYTDNSVLAATAYDYRVRALNGTVGSNYTNVATVTTSQSIPVAPSGLAATVLSSTSVRLNWTDNSNNETGFEIQRRIYPAAFGSIVTVGANVTTYTDNTVTPGNTYDYQIRANNSAGSSAFSGIASASTPQVAPAAPSNLTASYNTTTKVITLSWTDNSNNETAFTAQFSYSGSAFSDMGSTGANATTYSTGSNPPTGSYQFRVYAYNGLSSGYSNVASLIVTAPPPAATSIAWIQTAESTWGTPGTLTAAGYATNGTGTVQLVWRERSSTGVWGAWNTVPYQATVSPDTTWSNTISSGSP
ncbi:MAG TPA: fibronectin type III domain-containing protein, partial [Thermoanaerobaculia bacterium]